jgi:autotransporter-associated beta strand protein
LTLGSDNSSQVFGGKFGNGSTQPLSLTKVGSGTYTLTGDSTNSGTVTVSAGTLALAQSNAFYTNGTAVPGSGSFSNASFFAVSLQLRMVRRWT